MKKLFEEYPDIVLIILGIITIITILYLLDHRHSL
jgi:hypothetical protein